MYKLDADTDAACRREPAEMIQNLAWAVGYNVVAIPLAAGALYPYFIMSPAMGAVLMSLSTIIVTINAQLLRGTLEKN